MEAKEIRVLELDVLRDADTDSCTLLRSLRGIFKLAFRSRIRNFGSDQGMARPTAPRQVRSTPMHIVLVVCSKTSLILADLVSDSETSWTSSLSTHRLSLTSKHWIARGSCPNRNDELRHPSPARGGHSLGCGSHRSRRYRTSRSRVELSLLSPGSQKRLFWLAGNFMASLRRIILVS